MDFEGKDRVDDGNKQQNVQQISVSCESRQFLFLAAGVYFSPNWRDSATFGTLVYRQSRETSFFGRITAHTVLQV